MINFEDWADWSIERYMCNEMTMGFWHFENYFEDQKVGEKEYFIDVHPC